METLFIYLGLACAAIYVVSSIMIIHYLKEKGEKINFLWLRVLIISYADKYKKLTRKEYGKVGPLFYMWIISVNCALVCFILYIVFEKNVL